ncbi:hypothetical protein U472_11775 [Orenia metallireducens]|uniref:Transposase IS4-like domain-containing protein n=1 Tax=Orenia metallireducens TaxID=1413210 RepID=A0A1C0A8W3_9FIRM|nr:transposase [Orenia metallireducens]OCL26650.1 hypothetical protein U472_11775 [Orenia metallireducens]
MIIPFDELKENPFNKLCDKLSIIYNHSVSSSDETRSGRPKKYADLQIIKFKLYMVMNKIYCLRELEWKLSSHPIARSIIGLAKVPDHLRFCIRFNKIENRDFDKLYKMVVLLLNPDTRICSIDSTDLRSSQYDSQAKSGPSTRLGFYKGYKLHLICSNDSIQLSFEITTANVYDNTYSCCKKLIDEDNGIITNIFPWNR